MSRLNIPRTAFLSLVVAVLLLASAFAKPIPRREWNQPARVASASELIQLVNQLRAANGLPAYQVNRALMAAAQAHSEYQASIGSVTHSGPGGTRPRDRAIAAGYGGGGTVFISENIAGGRGLTPQQAIQWWQGDSLHINTMLSSSYQDVGAGVAEANGVVYYTLDVGYVAGVASPPQESAPGTPTGGGGAPTVTAQVIIPVQVATPRSDGSIVHVVQTGQALWNIAAAYKVPLTDLLALNGLTDTSFIYPGDKILVRPPQATATPSPTPTPTPAPTSTPRPSRTPTSAPVATQTLTPGLTSPSASTSPPAATDPLLVGIGVLATLGTALVLLGTLLKRRA